MRALVVVAAVLVGLVGLALAQDGNQICARENPETGRLTDISRRAPGPGDVVLSAWPPGDGPWVRSGTLAVPATRTNAEKADDIRPSRRFQAAIALRLSSGWAGLPAGVRAWAQDEIDGVASLVTTALAGQ